MLKIERQKIIEQEVIKQGFVLVPVLSGMLGCSEETVRRDIKEMAAAGRLIKTHGGAYLVENYDNSYPTELRRSYFHKTKERLAATAISHIQDNDVIMLDSSTTCLAIAELLLVSSLNLTIITNSLPIMNLCNDGNANINLICMGGTFRRRTSSFTDMNTVAMLKKYYADKAFVSCPKISMEFGLSDNHQSEANAREQMLRQASFKCLVLDHTKFNTNANILFEGMENVDSIITDLKLSDEWEAYAAKHSIRIEYSGE